MPDMTDDWWDKTNDTTIFQQSQPENKMEYLIERAEKQVCFGNPGYIQNWRFWASFDTAAKRDEELKRLRGEHPAWRLRTADRNPYLESLGIYRNQD